MRLVGKLRAAGTTIWNHKKKTLVLLAASAYGASWALEAKRFITTLSYMIIMQRLYCIEMRIFVDATRWKQGGSLMDRNSVLGPLTQLLLFEVW